MGTQKEIQPKKENNIYYDFKATQALEFAQKKARIEGRKLVNFNNLIEGINSQITPQEKLNIYKAYGIDYEIEEHSLKLKIELTVIREHFANWRFGEAQITDTELQFSPLAQRAVQHAEELAALKQDQTLDVFDLFRGAAKVAEDECAAQQTLFRNSVL